MIRNGLTAFFLMLCAATMAQTPPTETKVVTLSQDSPKDTITLPQKCNLFLSMSNMEFDGAAKVRIDIENLCDQQQCLLLFDRTYTEKELKKLNTGSVSFDKFFPYDQSRNTLEVCRNLFSLLVVEPESGSQFLLDINATDHGETPQKIPAYVAHKKKNKYLLSDLFFIDLKINVDLKPDTDYLKLEEEANKILEKKDKSFCSNKKHTRDGSVRGYRDDIDACIKRIDEVLQKKNYYQSDKAAQPYIQLKEKLKKIEIKEYDCRDHHPGPVPPPLRCPHGCKHKGGKCVSNCKICHPTPPHHCQYCKYSKKALQNMLTTVKDSAQKAAIQNCLNRKK